MPSFDDILKQGDANKDGKVSLPKTGKDICAQDRGVAQGRYYASPVAANGRVYVTLDDVTFTVLKGGADSPEVVVKNPKLGE